MSIPNYGKKLINDGVLICQPKLSHAHAVHEIWAPDFMESILFISSSKQNYTSVLHFFWQSIFHQREVTNQYEAEEIFSATHLYKISLIEAKQKIQKLCPNWFTQNKKLIPNAKWTHMIWNDENEVLITFEDEDMYYAWGWDSLCQNIMT